MENTKNENAEFVVVDNGFEIGILSGLERSFEGRVDETDDGKGKGDDAKHNDSTAVVTAVNRRGQVK